MKQPLFFVLIISVLLRLIYIAIDSNLIITADSYGYYNNAFQILHSDNPVVYIINDNKTPLYPLFLAYTVFPNQPLERTVSNPHFLLFANILFGIGTICAIMFCLSFFRLPYWLSSLVGIMIGTNTTLLYFEHTLLPESLSTFLLALSLTLFINVLKKFSFVRMVIIFIIGIFLFLLKPMFVAIPLLYYLFAIFYYKTRASFMIITCASLLYIGCIYGYMTVNQNINGYFGMNHSTDINLLGRIIQLNIPYASIDSFYTTKLKEYRKISSNYMPYRFMDWVGNDTNIYFNKPLLQELQIFTRTVIKNNLWEYVSKSIPDIPMLLVNPGLPRDVIIFPIITTIHTWIRFLVIIFIILIPYLLLLKIKRFYFVLLLCMNTIVIYVLFTITLGAFNDSSTQNDIGRVMMPVIPILYSVIAVELYKLTT